MTSEVHIVMANEDYESNSPLKAFVDKAAAEAWCARIREYEARRLITPPIVENDPENDREWDAWFKHDDAWRAKHPAGVHANASSYTIRSIPLVAARKGMGRAG